MLLGIFVFSILFSLLSYKRNIYVVNECDNYSSLSKRYIHDSLEIIGGSSLVWAAYIHISGMTPDFLAIYVSIGVRFFDFIFIYCKYYLKTKKNTHII